MAEAEQLGVAGGTTVESVMSGSPAERGGLRTGDVITAVGERAVTSSSGLVVALRHHQPGDAVHIVYWRDGRRHEATVTIGHHS
jgi:S1-C subfamily serine protease